MEFNVPERLGRLPRVLYGVEVLWMWGIFMKAKKPFRHACVPFLQYISFSKLAGKSGRRAIYFILPQLASFMLKTTYQQLQWWFSLWAIIALSLAILFFVFFPTKFLVFFLNIHLAKKFGKKPPFAFGMTVLPYIFHNILFFWSAKFKDSNNSDKDSQYADR